MSAPALAERQGWSIIVIGYDEVQSIARVVDEVATVLADVSSPERSEIILVDDGSTDGTPDLMRALAAQHDNVRCVCHEKNLGIGRALLSGYRLARFENTCAVPGDGQFDVGELRQIAAPPAGCLVSFFRARQIGYTPWRTALSRFNRVLNRRVLGVVLRDVNWVKIYKTASLQALSLRLTSSLVETEICAKLIRDGVRVIEIPSRYLPRRGGAAKGASPLTVLRAARDLLKLVVAMRSHTSVERRTRALVE